MGPLLIINIDVSIEAEALTTLIKMFIRLSFKYNKLHLFIEFDDDDKWWRAGWLLGRNPSLVPDLLLKRCFPRSTAFIGINEFETAAFDRVFSIMFSFTLAFRVLC